MKHKPVSLALAALVAACSSDPDEIEVAITLGYEDGAMTAAPAVTAVTVEAVDADGKVVASDTAAPGGTVELGDYAAEDFVSFEVRGTDASGATVLRGRSLGFVAGAIGSESIPLFAQRLGEFSRPPGGLAYTHVRGVATVVAERWLLLTGGRAFDVDGNEGTSDSPELYDLLAWDGASAERLPRAAASILARGTAVLLIDAEGATWFDFDSGLQGDATPPSGMSFADIAGGATVEGADGTTYVVGATRQDQPSTAILRVDAEGTLSAATLVTPRAGAAATWVDGVGLVVAGGSTEGAGVEVLGGDDASARALPFPPSGIVGAGLVAVGESSAMRVGGTEKLESAPTGVLALQCAVDCAVDEFPEGATVPMMYATQAAYATPRGVVTVGQDGSFRTHVFLVPLDRGDATELPLKEPRSGAAVIPAPNGTLAVLGGELLDGDAATHVEMFFPE